jgi:hypothetical protein
MLKPKYSTLSEAVADYKSLLGALDVRHPKDPSVLEGAERAQAKAKKASLSESVQRIDQKPVAKVQIEHSSRYTSSQTAMDSFRVLAGMTHQELMPRDPGMLGTTRHTAAILSEAGGLGQAGTGRQGSWGGQIAGMPEDAGESGMTAQKPQNHLMFGQKISQKAKNKSYFFRHNKHEMPPDARIKAHADLAAHHQATAHQLGQLSASATKRGDHEGAASLTDLQRQHHEISALHTARKHHKMFESKLADNEHEEDFE